MDDMLTMKEKKELSEMLRKGFELALKMESCIAKHDKLPVVITACAWILDRSRRVSPESVKEDFFGGVKHLMDVCGNCIEQFEKQESEHDGTDE